MATRNANNGCISRIAVLGDNHLASSILSGLSTAPYQLFHLVQHQSLPSSDQGIVVHRTDFSQASLSVLFQSIRPSLVISTQSGGSFEAQISIIHCAIDAGVPRFIPAEFGNDSLNEALWNKAPPTRERARVIEHLKEQALHGHISYVAVATGCILDRGLITGNLGFDLQWHSATIHGTSRERLAASSIAWIGGAIRRVIDRWDDTVNQYLYACGMIISADEIVKSLEKVSGQKWEIGQVDIDDTLREAQQRFERGFPDAGMFLMERAVLFDERLEAARPFIERDAKAELGLTAETIDDVITYVLHEHEHHGKGNCGCS